MHRRDTDGGGRGGGMRGGGGRDRYDGRGSNSRNGNNQEYGGWDDRRSQQQQQQQQQQPQEVTFTVPSGKCGVIIGRGMCDSTINEETCCLGGGTHCLKNIFSVHWNSIQYIGNKSKFVETKKVNLILSNVLDIFHYEQ